MNDPGLLVLPTHRLIRGLAPIASAELQAKLGECFTVQTIGQGPELAGSIWNDIAGANQQSRLAFYTAADNTWTLATISLVGAGRMAQLATDQSGDWQSLGVSILHRLVMENLLDHTDLPKPLYVHSAEEVIENLVKGDAVGRDATGQMGSGGRFELAALVMPATVDHVRAVSEHGERMPAKSTYFYPKLLGGLVVHLLE
jgi:hypothetical protein